MTGKNTTTRVFQISEKCKDFPSDKLLLALENLLFYPPQILPSLEGSCTKLVQKRFLVCQDCETIIEKLKEIYNFSTDKMAVNMAILLYKK